MPQPKENISIVPMFPSVPTNSSKRRRIKAFRLGWYRNGYTVSTKDFYHLYGAWIDGVVEHMVFFYPI